MKSVLIPTDFSDNSYGAIAYAVQMLENEECTFHLLHTYTPAIYQSEFLLHSPGQVGLGDIYRLDSEKRLNELKQTILVEYQNPKHHFETHSAFNILMEAIDELLEEKNIDLIIMGTQGATGAKEIFLGSNTVHAIKRSKGPILVVPFDYKFESPKNILFPTDYEIEYNNALVKELLIMAKSYSAKIDVMHISNSQELSPLQEANKTKLEKLLSGTNHHFHEVPDQGIIEAINNKQADFKTNFLVMVKNKHSFLENLFLKPVINQIGFHTTIPFLVLPYHLLE
ncbi:universal stress protein [Arenibacter certesii]|uniref:Universal stress protein UspA n=1 Tax=Arenibacter certesii TaxID=228955 RepID=A0A918MIY8_9FLAO|nr:universal stress protein [Arenibacter certesii]GGW30551.1 universal stress protein UspA [Arenibacter certesii]